MTPNPQLENWKEEFDKADFGIQVLLPETESKLKSFIESLLAARDQEFVEKLEEAKKRFEWKPDIEVIDSIIQYYTKAEDQ